MPYLANGESLDRARAPQWRIWHYGRYPWSSDVTDPRKEPPYALLVHFGRYDGLDTVQLYGKKLIPILRSKREFSTTISLARGFNSLSRSPMTYCP
jgi:hypothetical protein